MKLDLMVSDIRMLKIFEHTVLRERNKKIVCVCVCVCGRVLWIIYVNCTKVKMNILIDEMNSKQLRGTQSAILEI